MPSLVRRALFFAAAAVAATRGTDAAGRSAFSDDATATTERLNAFINFVDFGGCPGGDPEAENKMRLTFYFEGLPAATAFNVEFLANREADASRTETIQQTKLKPGHVVFTPLYTDFFNDPDHTFVQGGLIVLSVGNAEDGTYEQLDCIRWGDFEEAANVCSSSPLTGYHESGGKETVWRRIAGELYPQDFKGQFKGDFPKGGNPQGNNKLEVPDDYLNCSVGHGNAWQLIFGENDSTAWINEVIMGMPCEGYGDETAFHYGVELVAWGRGTYLLVVTSNEKRGYTWVTFDDCDDCWTVKFIKLDSMTADTEAGGLVPEDMKTGSAHLFVHDAILLSQIEWGANFYHYPGIQIDYARYDPDHVVDEAYPPEPWTYYPGVVNFYGCDRDRYSEVTGDNMGVMSDGGWYIKAVGEDADQKLLRCSPGDLNIEQTLAEMPPTVTTTTTTTTAPVEETTTTTTKEDGGHGGRECIWNQNCDESRWCEDESYEEWCPAQNQPGHDEYCPYPHCVWADEVGEQSFLARKKKAAFGKAIKKHKN